MVITWRVDDPLHCPVAISIASWMVNAGKSKMIKTANNRRTGRLAGDETSVAADVNRVPAISLDAVSGGGAILIQYL
jgi:hypothetical protein